MLVGLSKPFFSIICQVDLIERFKKLFQDLQQFFIVFHQQQFPVVLLCRFLR